ncbi:EamA family transporter [Robertkochia solimangrovi]|uniref:EamA family transporter n=1 Tax=Robertkochia solimangrovi TaxID=2213046 RepID=UPI001F54C7EA
MLFVIFKLFDRYKVNTFNAIVINYIIACVIGILLNPAPVNLSSIVQRPWFSGAVLLGFLFINVFVVMARTAQTNGLSVASIAGKMSLIIPVIFGVFAYHETMGPLKLTGILLALAAVYLVSVKKEAALNFKQNLTYPLLLFLGSGIIDTGLKYLENYYVQKEEFSIYSASIFGTAAFMGILMIIYRKLTGRSTLRLKDILGGIVLGIPNYFSIYFILMALRENDLDSATVFTINNVGIVMITTFAGILLFGERLNKRNWFGVMMAIVSIFVIAYVKN